MKNLAIIILKFIRLMCFPFKFFFNKNIDHHIYQLLRENKKSIMINKRKVSFFVPNQILDWRIRTYYSKEPDTLVWIKNFKEKKNLVFWDIGANVGLYSIYASIIHKKSSIF